MRLVAAAVAACIAFAVAGCQKAPQDSNALELRTYEVPKGSARPILATLKDVLWLPDNKNVGRVTMAPDGHIVVLAPENVQLGVEKLLKDIGHEAPADRTIELHYYVILGKPAASPVPSPPGVAEVQPALDEIVKSQGPQTFTLAKRLVVSSLNDEEAKLEGEGLDIRQVAVETGDDVYARLTVGYGKEDKIVTRVRLAPNGIIVLGATGQHAGDSADGATLYYLVRLAPHTDGKHP